MTLPKRIGITVLATGMAAIIAVAHHHYLPETAERIDLHGTWRVASRDYGGRPEPVSSEDRVVIDGVAMTFTFETTDNPKRAEARFRLSARPAPRHMNIHFPLEKGSVAANGWDGVTRLVYERDGSTLRLLWYTNDVSNADPNRRPTSMEGESGAYTARLTLAR
jgi:uncharacterized protein (TIGR03067 family)